MSDNNLKTAYFKKKIYIYYVFNYSYLKKKFLELIRYNILICISALYCHKQLQMSKLVQA